MGRMSRTYDQYCPVARTLEIVGERWTLLIARELLLGPRRFTDLRALPPAAGARPRHPPAVLILPVATLAEMATGALAVDAALERDAVKIRGDEAAARRFLDLLSGSAPPIT